MTGSTPDGAGAPRPEVVQAIFGALVDMDVAAAQKLADLRPTAAEVDQANHLFLASIQASRPTRERRVQALGLLIKRDREGLSRDEAVELAQLADVVPEYSVEMPPDEGEVR